MTSRSGVPPPVRSVAAPAALNTLTVSCRVDATKLDTCAHRPVVPKTSASHVMICGTVKFASNVTTYAPTPDRVGISAASRDSALHETGKSGRTPDVPGDRATGPAAP